MLVFIDALSYRLMLWREQRTPTKVGLPNTVSAVLLVSFGLVLSAPAYALDANKPPPSLT